MRNLMLKSDLQQYKHIYEALDTEANVESYIIESQLLDLKKWLGDAFLNELIDQRAKDTLTEENKIALYGGTYEFEGNTYYTEGIRAALAYYTYARFITRASAKATQFGVVIKTAEFSEPVSDKRLATLKNEALEAAEAFKQDVILLLNRRAIDYPTYNKGCVKSVKRKPPVRIIGQ